MTIVKRSIAPSATYGAQYVDLPKSREDGAEELRDNSMVELTGVLKQLGLLAHCATEMFSELYDMAMETNDGIESITNKIQHLETTLLEDNRTGSSDMDDSTPMPSATQNLLDKEKRLMIAELYDECESPPALHLLDEVQGTKCLENYSNPGLFFAEWSKEEELKQAKEEKKLRLAQQEAARRRNMSRAARSQPRHNDKRDGSRKPGKLLLQRKGSVSRIASLNAHKSVETKWKQKSQVAADSTPVFQRTRPKEQLVCEEKGVDAAEPQRSMGVAKMAVKSETEVEQKRTAPSRPVGALGNTGGRGDLLAAIRGGASLKSAQAASRPMPSGANPGGKGDLLAAIRGGTSLKSAQAASRPIPSGANAGGKGDLLASIRNGKSLKSQQAPSVPTTTRGSGGGKGDLLAAIRNGRPLKSTQDSSKHVATPIVKQSVPLKKVSKPVSQPVPPSTGNGALLAAIRQGKALKKAAANEPTQARAPPSSGAPSFLADIQAGVKLAKSRPPKESPTKPQEVKRNEARSGLLDQIKSGRQVLKKVSEKPAPKPQQPSGGGCNTVAEILARRMAILGSAGEISDSDESDNSWDDDSTDGT